MFRITRGPSTGSFLQCLAKITVMVLSCPLICHNTDYIHINGHDRTITVILAKHCRKLPVDGHLVIRNMLGAIVNILKYFIIILIVSTNYIFVQLLDNKVF